MGCTQHTPPPPCTEAALVPLDLRSQRATQTHPSHAHSHAAPKTSARSHRPREHTGTSQVHIHALGTPVGLRGPKWAFTATPMESPNRSHVSPAASPTSPALNAMSPSRPQLRLQTEPLLYLGSKVLTPAPSPINGSQVPMLWMITPDQGWGQEGGDLGPRPQQEERSQQREWLGQVLGQHPQHPSSLPHARSRPALQLLRFPGPAPGGSRSPGGGLGSPRGSSPGC